MVINKSTFSYYIWNKGIKDEIVVLTFQKNISKKEIRFLEEACVVIKRKKDFD